MLPYFAGTGHNNYARFLYWFLQEMPASNPTVQEEFKKGQFVELITEKANFGQECLQTSALSKL